ncbi:hypothetical protein HDU67_005825, partial [Dinochytrium kinnereticum]
SPVADNKKKTREIPEIEPIIATDSYLEREKLYPLVDSAILPVTLVYLDKVIKKQTAIDLLFSYRNRLKDFADTANLHIDRRANLTDLIRRLNELHRRYIARRESFYDSAAWFFRDYRNFVASTEVIEVIPDLEKLTDADLRRCGIFYYQCHLEVEEAKKELAAAEEIRPALLVKKSVGLAKRASAAAIEERRRKKRTIEVLDSAAKALEETAVKQAEIIAEKDSAVVAARAEREGSSSPEFVESNSMDTAP